MPRPVAITCLLYTSETNSVCSGQVLHCPYDFEKAKLVVKEMTDQMVLDLVDKKLVTDQIVLTVGYDIENLNNADRKKQYHGAVSYTHLGLRKAPGKEYVVILDFIGNYNNNFMIPVALSGEL